MFVVILVQLNDFSGISCDFVISSIILFRRLSHRVSLRSSGEKERGALDHILLREIEPVHSSRKTFHELALRQNELAPPRMQRRDD